MKHFRIGTHTIPGRRAFIIAEAGVNHNGKLALALKLVDAAKRAGADAVKFQNFKAEDVAVASAPQAAYQQRNTAKKESQLSMIRRLALSEGDFKKIAAHAKRRGIIFLSTPHGGFHSADMLRRLRVPAYKVGSGDLTNLPLLAYIARFRKPLILSSGMATREEIGEALRVVRKAGGGAVAVLQCTTDYPTKPADVNIRAMTSIGKTFGVPVGFSDHTRGVDAALLARALGASIIEKHLTLDKGMQGPDHRASADEKEFARYVHAIRAAEAMLGSGEKKPTATERAYMPIVRKSLVVSLPVKKGERFSEENLAIKRPGTGLPPKRYFSLLGKRAKRDFLKDEVLTKKDV